MVLRLYAARLSFALMHLGTPERPAGGGAAWPVIAGVGAVSILVLALKAAGDLCSMPLSALALSLLHASGVVHVATPASCLLAMSSDWLWWGGGLAAGLAGGIIWGLAQIRRHELRRERMAQQRFLERLLESQEQERRRIASELHDSLGQNLLIIRNRALLGLECAADPAAVAEQFKEISQTALASVEECREIAHNLSTSHLDQLGMTDAIDGMVDRVADSAGLRFERKLEAVDELFTLPSATHLYRIAQEALNNVIRHAKASTVRVELTRDVKHVLLAVQDIGQGFDARSSAQAGRSGGMGLAEIAERVRLLHGTLDVNSRPGDGTRLAVTVPVKEGDKV